MTIPTTTLDAIRELQAHVGEGNRARGFREDEELLDALFEIVEGFVNGGKGRAPGSTALSLSFDQAHDLRKVLKIAKVHGQANRMMLMVSEIVEAHDEIRSGLDVTRTYYPAAEDSDVDAEGNITQMHLGKPEGVPSEIADTFIRTLDFADTYGIDLAEIIAEKYAYNATRPYRHGRKF